MADPSLIISITSLVLSTIISLTAIVIAFLTLNRRFSPILYLVQEESDIKVKNVGRGYALQIYLEVINKEGKNFHCEKSIDELKPGEEKEILDLTQTRVGFQYGKKSILVVYYRNELRRRRKEYFGISLGWYIHIISKREYRKFNRDIKKKLREN